MELVAALPLVLLAALVAWQLALAGHAMWLCAHAARVAARADAVGRSARGGRAQRCSRARSSRASAFAGFAAAACASRFACRSSCPHGTRPSAWPPPRRSGARVAASAREARPGHRGAARHAPGSCWRSRLACLQLLAVGLREGARRHRRRGRRAGAGGRSRPARRRRARLCPAGRAHGRGSPWTAAGCAVRLRPPAALRRTGRPAGGRGRRHGGALSRLPDLPGRRGLAGAALSAAGSWLLEPADRAEREPVARPPVAEPRPVIAVFGLAPGCGATDGRSRARGGAGRARPGRSGRRVLRVARLRRGRRHAGGHPPGALAGRRSARRHTRRRPALPGQPGPMRWRWPTARATSPRSCSMRAQRRWVAGTRRLRTAWFWSRRRRGGAGAGAGRRRLPGAGGAGAARRPQRRRDTAGGSGRARADAAAFADGRPAGSRRVASRAASLGVRWHAWRTWCRAAVAPGKGSGSARASRSEAGATGRPWRWTGSPSRCPTGEVLGFVGPNGSGKTTAMRIAMGVLEQDSGEVRWKGATATRDDQSRFGYMPEERGLYPKMRVDRQLRYLASLHGRSQSEAAEAAARWVERLGLERDEPAARGGAVAGKPAAGPAGRGAGARPERADPGRALLGPRSDRHRRDGRGAPGSAPPMAWR